MKRSRIIAAEKAIYPHAGAIRGVPQGSRFAELQLLHARPIQGLLAACLEAGPCCCALLLVVAFKNYVQQALLLSAISSPNKILSAWAQIIYQSVRLSKQELAIIELIA